MHLFGSFLVILCSIRFAVPSLQPIKPDKIEIWAPWVINEHKLLSDKWKAQKRNIYCSWVRALQDAAQAAVVPPEAPCQPHVLRKAPDGGSWAVSPSLGGQATAGDLSTSRPGTQSVSSERQEEKRWMKRLQPGGFWAPSCFLFTHSGAQGISLTEKWDPDEG